MNIDRTYIREFYENNFNVSGLKSIIESKIINKPFDTREFGFKFHDRSDVKYSVSRQICFDNYEDLIDYLIIEAPLKSYLGGIYEKKFPKEDYARENIRKNHWLGHEIVCDIDLDHYGSIRKRICSCEFNKTICDKCIKLAKESVDLLIDIFINDFGFKKENIKIFFSGRQGFHLWVTDVIRLLNDNEFFDDKLPKRLIMRKELELRNALSEYIQLVNEKIIKKKVNGKEIKKHILSLNYTKLPIKITRRVIKKLFKNLVVGDPESIWKEFKGMKLKYWKEIRKMFIEYDDDPENVWNFMKSKFSRLKEKYLFDKVIELRYPRYDLGSTKDIHRIMKIPYSVDGSTGNICVPIKDIENFRIEDIPNIVKDKNQ